jgi:hypothetical protein
MKNYSPSLQEQAVGIIKEYLDALKKNHTYDSLATHVNALLGDWQAEDNLRLYPQAAAQILMVLTKEDCSKAVREAAGGWCVDALAEMLSKMIEFCVWMRSPQLLAELLLSELEANQVDAGRAEHAINKYKALTQVINYKS